MTNNAPSHNDYTPPQVRDLGSLAGLTSSATALILSSVSGGNGKGNNGNGKGNGGSNG